MAETSTSLTQSKDLSETQATDESGGEPIGGSRFKVLKDVMKKTIDSFTRNLKLLPPVPNVDKKTLKNFHKDAISQFEKNVKSEFNQMCDEENVEYLLNNLDKLDEQSVTNENSEFNKWRPSGNVEADLRAHVVHLKQEKLKVLQKVLAGLEAQNKMMIAKAQKKENILQQTIGEIRYTLNDLRQTTQMVKTAVDSLFIENNP